MHRTARFLSWNLMGQVAPLAIAFVAYPLLLHRAGVERLGFLALAWALIGYLGLLDLGLARVLVRRIAAARARGEAQAERGLVRAIAVLWFVAVSALALLAWLLLPASLPASIVSPAIAAEVRLALPILLSALAPTVVASILSGVLEGSESFGPANLLRAVFGAWGYVGPLAVLAWTPSLAAMVGAVALGRWLALFLYARQAARCLPGLWSASRGAQPRPAVGAALREGGWIAVSNVIGPMMMYLDRFVLAGLFSVAVVAYYTTPYDLVSKLLILPVSLMGALYPAFARSHGADPARVGMLYTSSLKATLAGMLPACVGVIALAHDGLAAWLGPRFAASAFPVLQVLAAAMLFNAVAHVPYGAIQSAGRPDLTAKCHVVELPLYAALLFGLAAWLGLVGAALAWLLRALVDLGLLLVLSRRFTGISAWPVSAAGTAGALALVAAAFASGQLDLPLGARLGLDALLVAASLALAWRAVLGAPERAALAGLVSRGRPGSSRTLTGHDD